MAMIRTYTETYDMNTEQDCPTILSIHTPIGTTPYRFLEPAFKMYMKYKYLGCDVTIVNAARLPVDPEQLGKIGGTNYIDPRDTLNPILFKGCHGESLSRILDSMYDGAIHASLGFTESSMDKDILLQTLQNFYYTALGDDSWRKSPIQKTLRINGLHPLVYSLATQHQILPTNSLGQGNYEENQNVTVTNPQNLGNVAGAENGLIGPDPGTGWESPQIAPTLTYNPATGGYDYRQGLSSMFTSRMHKLGWLDTMQYVGQNSSADGMIGASMRTVALLPKIFMGILMLPPANLCRQYLRVIIRHKFKFAKFRTVTTGGVSNESFDPSSFSIGYKNNYTGNIPDGGTKIEDDPVLDREVIEDDD